MVSASIKDLSTPIVVYCSLGVRSENISEKLNAAGFTDVRNLYGGIFEWKNKHNPVFDSEEIETEKVHTYSKNWSKWLTNGEKIY
jgi:3-mercaptopyruvate sulfurtransferase SseA